MNSYAPLLMMLCSLAGAASAAEANDNQNAPGNDRPKIDVVFVLDTTGSMGGLLEGAKQKIFSIASKMAAGQPSPIIRMGLVAYRDRSDAYVTQRFTLSNNLDAFYAQLRSLSAGGGGDTPEHVGRGLGEAVKLMPWSDDKRTMKTIFLVGDAPSQHYQDGWDAADMAREAAKRHIVVNAIRCGNDHSTELEFRRLASMTDGLFLSIAQTGGVVATSTPYDAEMARLDREVAGTAILAGSKDSRAEAKRNIDSVSTMGAGATADRVGYRMKAYGGVAAPAAPPPATGVMDVVNKPAAIATIPEADLPAELQAMPAEKREAFVKQKAEQRQQIENELGKLAKRRDEWLKKNTKAGESEFDDKVQQAVSAQAKEIGVTY